MLETLVANFSAADNPGYPAEPDERDAFLREQGAPVVLLTDYDPERGDRLADFLSIAEVGSGREATAEAAPARSCFTLRFSEPVDIESLQLVTVVPAGAPHVCVPMRVVALDATNTAFRFEPPMGLPFAPADKEAARPPQFHLRIQGGPAGVRGTSGRQLGIDLDLPISLDTNSEINLVGWQRLPNVPVPR